MQDSAQDREASSLASSHVPGWVVVERHACARRRQDVVLPSDAPRVSRSHSSRDAVGNTLVRLGVSSRAATLGSEGRGVVGCRRR